MKVTTPSPPRIDGPPRWATRFLEWYCRPSLYEDLQGDLHEFFDRNVEKRGIAYAKLIYIIDVLKFFRPYTVQKPQIFKRMNQFVMFGNYFKTSVRSMARNRLFTAINVVGLAISMSVGLLMVTFMTEIYSFDTFHTHADRIFRVGNHFKYLERDNNDFASTSILAGRRIAAEVPGIESHVILNKHFGGDAAYGDKIISIRRAFWASEEFFSVFSFRLIDGNPATALQEPYSIVLSQSTAAKVFGDEDPMGKTIRISNRDNFLVTGIMADIPHNSHFQAEALGSFITYENSERENKDLMGWDNMWSNYVYLLLQPGQDPDDVQRGIDAINEDELEKDLEKNAVIAAYLQPLSTLMPGPDLSNQIGRSMDAKFIWVMTGLALVVLISACFNYTNLSIARALRRSREVGIRKLVGASRGQVFIQFVFESVLISFLALIFAALIFYSFLKPQTLAMNDQLQRIVNLEPEATTLYYFVLLGVTTGFVAGFLPALFYSKIKAFKVLKDVSSLRLFSNLSMRKVLIVFQYTLSLGFIIAASIIYKQYSYSVGFDLGYKTENILNIHLQGNEAAIVKQELSLLPEVEAISMSDIVTSVGNYYATSAKFRDTGDSINNMYYNRVDEHYIPLHGHQLIAGNNFIVQADSSEESQLIVNEKLLKTFNAGDPMDAIGKTILVDKKDMKIVGVVKDFHYGRLDVPVNEFAFRYLPKGHEVVNLHIRSGDLVETIGKVEAVWSKIDKIHPLEAMFFDQEIQKSYDFYFVMVKTIGFLAFLAIVIASMGLLGMVVFTTETRLKEISIRKVLGASEGNLVFLLGRGFIILLLVATILAVPTTWYTIENFFLNDVEYRVSPGFLELFGGVLVVFAIAVLAIGSQTIKAARTNPAETLRNE